MKKTTETADADVSEKRAEITKTMENKPQEDACYPSEMGLKLELSRGHRFIDFWKLYEIIE